ncbi:MAG: ATP-binding cassette domain-containing protein [Enterovibrio sp.]
MTALLEVKDLYKTYCYRTGFFKKEQVEAVKPISFSLDAGETLAIIGTTGSGKSTLARMLAGIIEPSGGEILVNGEPLTYSDYKTRCKLIRIIFQDPSNSLNPRNSIGKILETPLKRNTDMSASEREKRVFATLRQVGLLPDHAYFYPQMLAVGQKQRVSLARALILQPSIIVADQALIGLDMSMRSQIINLLLELQELMGLSYIYVSQHLGIVKHISDKVMLLDDGMPIEYGATQAVFDNPQHQLMQRLIESHFNMPLVDK